MDNFENAAQNEAQMPELIKNAVHIIETNYTFLYGVESIAEQLQVTKYHLIREFTRYLGVSPGNYLKETRMQKAASLLCCEDYSIDVVASMVGYEGANYFCKVFKSFYGVSPGKYRALNRHAPAKPEGIGIYFV